MYRYKGVNGKWLGMFACLHTDTHTGKCVEYSLYKTYTTRVYHHQAVMSEKVIVRTLLLDGGDKMPTTGDI